MYDKDFAELVKIAAEKLKEDTVYKMLIHSEDCMIPLRGSMGLSITEGIILPLRPMKAISCYVPLKCLTMTENLSGKRICSRNGQSNRTVPQLLWKPQVKPLPFPLERKPVLI